MEKACWKNICPKILKNPKKTKKCIYTTSIIYIFCIRGYPFSMSFHWWLEEWTLVLKHHHPHYPHWDDSSMTCPLSFLSLLVVLPRRTEGSPWALGPGGEYLTRMKTKQDVLFLVIIFWCHPFLTVTQVVVWKGIWTLHIRVFQIIEFKSQRRINTVHADGEEDVEK